MNRTLICAILCCLAFVSCSRQNAREEVVVYTALDQTFSEPIFKQFEAETGIRVKPVFDTEAVKSVGLVARLIGERNNPQCDVFWNNEIVRTILLKRKGILAKTVSSKMQPHASKYIDSDGYWVGFAGRLRVIVYNTELLTEAQAPKSIKDFADPEWRGKLAIAYPLYGTTEIHFGALKVAMGDSCEDFIRRIKDNDVAYVDGNAQVVSLVAQGKYVAGFTDTDDVNVAILEGKPVGMIFPDQKGMGSLLIPNTVAIVRDCPHPGQALKLVEFLIGEEVQDRLAKSPSAQIPITDNVRFDKSIFGEIDIEVMDVDFDSVADIQENFRKFLTKTFVR